MTSQERDDLNEKLRAIIEKYHAPEDLHMDDYIKSHEEYAEKIAVPLLADIAELRAENERVHELYIKSLKVE